MCNISDKNIKRLEILFGVLLLCIILTVISVIFLGENNPVEEVAEDVAAEAIIG